MGDLCKVRICIDRDECIGDSMCVNEAPETFDLDDESKAFVLEGAGDSLENIMAAAQGCPLDIIKVYDKETGKLLYPAE